MRKILFILIFLLFILNSTTINSSNKFGFDSYKGMTISCQTWGYEWATPEMKESLVELKSLGVNSFSIHPYARIQNNGRIKYSNSTQQNHISTPLKWAKELDLKVMLKPHLAYWGSKFSWRGDINFNTSQEWNLFFNDYKDWILTQAQMAEEYQADIFCIGVEYKHSLKFVNKWKTIIKEIRKIYSGKITYGANWDTYPLVEFWDELDYIGIQAYFPIVDTKNPSMNDLQKGWQTLLKKLQDFSAEKNKPILFTELGYNASEYAGKRPWASYESDSDLALLTQQRCLQAAMENINDSHFIAGVFLWKWFPEIKEFRWRENFNLQTAENKKLIAKIWNNSKVSKSINNQLAK